MKALEARARRLCRELSEAINSSLQPLLLPARLRRPILEAAPEPQRPSLEQALAIAFAANGLVKAKIRTASLDDVNAVLDEMRQGKIVGRVVLKLA